MKLKQRGTKDASGSLPRAESAPPSARRRNSGGNWFNAKRAMQNRLSRTLTRVSTTTGNVVGEVSKRPKRSFVLILFWILLGYYGCFNISATRKLIVPLHEFAEDSIESLTGYHVNLVPPQLNVTAVGDMLLPGQYEVEAGRKASRAGFKAKHPVVIIPGIVSTGLELWRGKPCMDGNFRKRIWGSMSMMKMIASSLQCWIQHMSLDRNTGADPEGIRVRAAEGLAAADFLFPGFWFVQLFSRE